MEREIENKYEKKYHFESIRKQRLQVGITVADVAEHCKVSRQAVYNWEQGKLKPTTKHISKLSEVLETDVGILVAYLSN